MNNTRKIRAHPIMIFTHIKRFLWLWIIPILRAVIAAFRGELSLWSQGLWIDILIILSMFVFATLRWLRCGYSYNQKYIMQRDGLLFSRVTRLEWNRISVIKTLRPFYLRPFGAVVFHADTIGGSNRRSDIDIYLTKKESEKLLLFFSELDLKPAEIKNFKPKKSSILGFALVSTNYFVGFVYIATFISQSGKLMGEEFSRMIIGSFENLARTLSEYIPPAAAAIAYLVLLTWIIGVVFTILRYHNYNIKRKNQHLSLSSGLLSKQNFEINIQEVNYINIKQNVITFMLKICSVFISVVGIEKEKTDISCIIPAESKDSYSAKIEYLLPEFSPTPKPQLTPVPFGFMRFLSTPIICTIALALLLAISLFLIPSWSTFIRFVSYMLFIPCVGFFVIRWVEYRNSGIGKENGLYSISYSSGFTMHTLLIPKDKIVKVHIRQSWMQYVSGKCDVFIYTVSEGKEFHKCRNFKKSDVEAFFEIDRRVQPENLLGNILIKFYNKFNIPYKKY